VQLHAATWMRVNLYHPAFHSIRIELLVPRRVERICEIDALSVAAKFDHLRPAIKLLLGFHRMSGSADNASNVDRTSRLWIGGIRNIVLDELPRPPTRDVEETVIEREIDIRYQRWDCFEAL